MTKAELAAAWEHTVHIPRWVAWCFSGSLLFAAGLAAASHWQALSEAQQQLAAFNAAPAFTVDASGLVTTWNARMTEKTGYTAAYMLRHPFYAICDPEWVKLNGRPVMDALQAQAQADAGKPLDALKGRTIIMPHVRIVRADGDPLTTTLTIRIDTADGERIATVTSGRRPLEVATEELPQ